MHTFKPQLFVPLTQVLYPYNGIDIHRARGLRGLTWGLFVAAFIGLLYQFVDAIETDAVFARIGGFELTLARGSYFLIVLVSLINLLLVMAALNRGRLARAQLAAVISLYLVAVLAYGPMPATSFVLLTFSLPITAAGVLLAGRQRWVLVSITISTIIALIIFRVGEFLTQLGSISIGASDALIFGVLILAVDSVILSVFAGGQRALLDHNISLNQKLEAAEAKWRAIISNAPVTITYTHPDGVVEFVNQTANGNGEKLVGQSIIQAAAPDQQATVWQAIHHALTQKTPAHYEASRTTDDSITYYETWVGPVEMDGKTIGLTFITTDITERIQAAAVAEKTRHQQQIIELQKEAIKELSTPVIPIAERIIAMPLVGAIDTARARDVTRALLAGISQHRAHILILDVTGVPIIDSGVADHLNRSIQAVRLKGAHTIISGLSDAVAETIVDLGIDWSGVETVRDLQTALHRGLNRLQNGKSQAS
ncbi:MAG TPA: STAS domain-containing protein [Phototrophicaceae bacterium]|nr:STAS domain-containing protein [Phototrophicaceae bacterium]